MRKVLILLDRVSYLRLAEQARQDEREVHQQATYLLKRTLEHTGCNDEVLPSRGVSEEVIHAGSD